MAGFSLSKLLPQKVDENERYALLPASASNVAISTARQRTTPTNPRKQSDRGYIPNQERQDRPVHGGQGRQ